MELELRFFANFREAVGQKTLEREYPEGTAVGEVLGDLAEEFDMNLFEDGELRQQLSIMKNGKDVVHLDGVDTPLADGDVLSVFPPVAGGSPPRDGSLPSQATGE
ncbi:ubiquitin-like small modifier protein 1 [Halorussus litoreus]|uniref:ubiquitin-like small modifier protein 1 n=1 Tax=Halorussus litoreus TaxID=1710536 RepID=UPI000E2670D9|nr:ubiquitin-like small modifier protein 1 [Halorussus litoreus]